MQGVPVNDRLRGLEHVDRVSRETFMEPAVVIVGQDPLSQSLSAGRANKELRKTLTTFFAR